MYETPHALLKSWMEGVNSGNIEGTLSLYSDEAVLLPTFSNRTLSTPQAIRDYFVQLGQRPGLSVELHTRTLAVHDFNSKIYALSGIYLWRFEVDDELLSFEARFSFVIDISLNAPIVHHHSSQLPRMI
ncbi:MAG: hypothetical protein DHS20C01_07840 [marine bacterium B5-7]|nr:MAG: hypothetical protein DHS20C01_07840 [marine bacterium B5-7]